MALADSTRRSILARVAVAEMSIGEIATYYKLTFAAISKHIKMLERAGLVSKRRRGKEQVVTIVPGTVAIAQQHIDRYARLWAQRLDKLETLLQSTKQEQQQ